MFVQAVRIQGAIHSPTDDGFNMTRGRMNLPGVKGSAAAGSLGPASRSGPTFFSSFVSTDAVSTGLAASRFRV